MPERDHWSTDHADARRKKINNLIDTEGVYACEDCGKGPDELPISGRFHRDHPNASSLSLAQGELVVPTVDGKAFRLEVDHVDKNIENDDLNNLLLRCNSCHAKADRATGIGVAQAGADPDPMGYAILDLMDPSFTDPNFTEAIVAHARKPGKRLARVENLLDTLTEDLEDIEGDSDILLD